MDEFIQNLQSVFSPNELSVRKEYEQKLEKMAESDSLEFLNLFQLVLFSQYNGFFFLIFN